MIDQRWLKRLCAAVLILWPVLLEWTEHTPLMILLTFPVYLAIGILTRTLSIGIGTLLGIVVGQVLGRLIGGNRWSSAENRVVAEFLILAGGICGAVFGFVCLQIRSRHLTNCFALLSVGAFLIEFSGLQHEYPWLALLLLVAIIVGCIVWQRIVAANDRRPQPVKTARHAP